MRLAAAALLALAACGTAPDPAPATATPDPEPRIVVVIGDSIVSGEALDDPTARWTDLLPYDDIRNAGMGMNTITAPDPWDHPTIEQRFDRDVLDVPGVTDVVIAAGVNDLGHADPGRIASSLFALWNRADAAGLNVAVATILPNQISPEHTQLINDYLRDRVPGVCDLDGVPITTIDGLHPDAASQQAIADTIAACLG